LRCDGIFIDSIITNFLLILTVKKFENWSMFNEVIKRTKIVLLFGPRCMLLMIFCYWHFISVLFVDVKVYESIDAVFHDQIMNIILL